MTIAPEKEAVMPDPFNAKDSIAENPITENPVVQFVERNHSNPEISSFKNFARACGVSEQTISKINKGLYNHLPPSVAKTLSYYSAQPMNVWARAYNSWRNECINMLKLDIEQGRIEADAIFLNADEIPKRFESFVDWRRSLNSTLMGFCTEFYLHQGTMYRFESGEGFDLPIELQSRLLFLGCNQEYIDALKRLPRRTIEL